ncbi:MAG: pentapeptide repeat-containing protein, partial [Rhodospirillaceae bacterium]|nr:pentapeptide repeat-containing protein [Rhodospirillaceae bacterium]
MRTFLKISLAVLIILGAIAAWLFGYDEPRVKEVKANNGCPSCDLKDASLWWIVLQDADLQGADLS